MEAHALAKDASLTVAVELNILEDIASSWMVCTNSHHWPDPKFPENSNIILLLSPYEFTMWEFRVTSAKNLREDRCFSFQYLFAW